MTVLLLIRKLTNARQSLIEAWGSGEGVPGGRLRCGRGIQGEEARVSRREHLDDPSAE